MKELICKNCGPTQDYMIVSNGPHNQAKCNKCDSHLGFVKKENTNELQMYFGKYKNVLISKIDDVDYLEWVLRSNETLNAKYMVAIQDRINDIKINSL